METEFKKKRYLVDRMLYPGLYILAGAPKVGKSWLAMQLCVSVALGEQFLKHETDIGQAVYLALEDDEGRLQDRVYEFIDVPTENLEFAIASESIDNGLENQIRTLGETHDNLKLVIIDTMQKIRETTDISYAKDYKDMSVLKNLATELGITIILIHHTCKRFDDDPFNMVSGSTGLNGCVDGLLVLMKAKRSANQATLHCTGRDIEDTELLLTRQGARWTVTDEREDKPPDIFSFAIHDLMIEKLTFKGSATELCGLLTEKYSREFFPNMIKKDLTLHGYELQSYGVKFSHKRSNGQRLIMLEYDRDSDTGDGRNLMPEPSQNADPAVTAEQTESSQTADTIGSSATGESNTCEKSTDPVGQLAVPFCSGADPEYIIINGKKVEVKSYSINELLHQCAAKIRAKVFAERGILVPEFDPTL